MNQTKNLREELKPVVKDFKLAWRISEFAVLSESEVFELVELFQSELQKERKEMKEFLLKRGHGGGNFRRLIVSYKDDQE